MTGGGGAPHIFYRRRRRGFMVGGVGGVRPDDRESNETAHSPDRRFFWFYRTGVSNFTCDLRWAAGADNLTVNMHAMHNFTVLMSCSLPNF